MQEFNKGDRVLLRKDSEYYGGSEQLPPDEVGTVVETNVYTYEVSWYGGEEQNVYEHHDLELAVKLIHPTIKLKQ